MHYDVKNSGVWDQTCESQRERATHYTKAPQLEIGSTPSTTPLIPLHDPHSKI